MIAARAGADRLLPAGVTSLLGCAVFLRPSPSSLPFSTWLENQTGWLGAERDTPSKAGSLVSRWRSVLRYYLDRVR